MNKEQVSSLQPALADLLSGFRDCFRRKKAFDHWETYIAGLISDLKRKSIEPIALAAKVPVRTLQEVLADFKWDHGRAEDRLHGLVVDRHGCETAIGVLDASAHVKQGQHTPGVQRQWCGETGKVDNCIVGQHLLYTDNHPTNPFRCILCSDLFLPESWDEDRERCRRARIPDEVVHRANWLSSRIAMYFLASQTQRLRGGRSADHAGAGCGRDERAGGEDLADLASILRGADVQLPVPSVA